VRRENPGVEAILADYRARTASLQQLTNYVAAVNEIQFAPDVQQALAGLRFFPIEGITVKSMQVKSDGNALHIQLTGSATARTFVDMRGNYQRLLDHIKRLPTMSLLAENLNLRDGSFTVSIHYGRT
jgi:hypothetical protein